MFYSWRPFPVGRRFPDGSWSSFGKHIPYGKGFMVRKTFPVGKCISIGKCFPDGRDSQLKSNSVFGWASQLESVSQLGSIPNFMTSRADKMGKPFPQPSKLGKFSRRLSSGILGNIHPWKNMFIYTVFSLYVSSKDSILATM